MSDTIDNNISDVVFDVVYQRLLDTNEQLATAIDLLQRVVLVEDGHDGKPSNIVNDIREFLQEIGKPPDGG